MKIIIQTLLILYVLSSCASDTKNTGICPSNEAFIYSGRVFWENPKEPEFNHSGVRIRTVFSGTSLKIKMESEKDTNFFYAIINDTLFLKFAVPPKYTEIEICNSLPNQKHHLEIVKLTESILGNCKFYGLELDNNARIYNDINKENRLIHFIGNSITCGYGIEAKEKTEKFHASTENFYDAYACITARSLKCDYNIVARSGIGMYRNYNEAKEGSKECMPAIYNRYFYDKETPIFDYQSISPDLICINLGTNDFSTIGGDTSLYTSNYIDFLKLLKTNYPYTPVICLIGPMWNSQLAKDLVQNIVNRVKVEFGDNIHFLKLSAQGKYGFGADWHPSRQQALINAKELIEYISKLMKWEYSEPTQSTQFTIVNI